VKLSVCIRRTDPPGSLIRRFGHGRYYRLHPRWHRPCPHRDRRVDTHALGIHGCGVGLAHRVLPRRRDHCSDCRLLPRSFLVVPTIRRCLGGEHLGSLASRRCVRCHAVATDVDVPDGPDHRQDLTSFVDHPHASSRAPKFCQKNPSNRPSPTSIVSKSRHTPAPMSHAITVGAGKSREHRSHRVGLRTSLAGNGRLAPGRRRPGWCSGTDRR
jgi:hypothetical protein